MVPSMCASAETPAPDDAESASNRGKKAGEMAIATNFIPGILASMPNCALPLTLSAESKRLTGVPIRVKSFGCFSATLSGAGNGNAAFALASNMLMAGMDAPVFKYACETMVKEANAFDVKMKAAGLL